MAGWRVGWTVVPEDLVAGHRTQAKAAAHAIGVAAMQALVWESLEFWITSPNP